DRLCDDGVRRRNACLHNHPVISQMHGKNRPTIRGLESDSRHGDELRPYVRPEKGYPPIRNQARTTSTRPIRENRRAGACSAPRNADQPLDPEFTTWNPTRGAETSSGPTCVRRKDRWHAFADNFLLFLFAAPSQEQPAQDRRGTE